MQQWWFEDGLGLKSVVHGVAVFYDFPLILRISLIFMNIKIKQFASLAMGLQAHV